MTLTLTLTLTLLPSVLPNLMLSAPAPVELTTPGAPSEVLARLAIDVVAMSGLLALVALRRRGGRDLITACAAFNSGLFAVAQIITAADIGIGAGFGLFAVLSIIRLRSELFTNVQLAYVFATLALALCTGIPGVSLGTGALLALLLVGTLAVVDVGRHRAVTTRATVTLERVIPDHKALVAELEQRLGRQVLDHTVLEVDLVRDTTRLEVASRPWPAAIRQERVSLLLERL